MRITCLRICALSLFLALGGETIAQSSGILTQSLRFQQLPESLGLTEPSVNCIIQDDKGYLWIGTWSGLIRYDGYSVKTYYSNNSPYSIKSNKITSLAQDRDGFIWVGTHKGGLFKYDPESGQFSRYSNDPANPNSLSSDNIWAIVEDYSGKIWIGTENGLNILDKGTGQFSQYYSSSRDSLSLSDNFIRDIHESASGEMWIATEAGFNQAVRQGGKLTFRRFFYASEEPEFYNHNYFYQIDDLKVNGREEIWVTSKIGLKKFQDGKLESFETDGATTGDNLFRCILAVDKDVPLILAGSETGLSVFDPAAETYVLNPDNNPDKSNLSHGSVTTVFIDQTEVLWVGTMKGINKLDTYSKNFTAFKSEDFDPEKSIITGIREDSSGAIWIGTMGSGLFKYNRHAEADQPFMPYAIQSVTNDDYSSFIQTLFIDSRNRLWLGTAGDGIYYFKEAGSGELTDMYHLDFYEFVMSIEEDRSGNIWLGTWNGNLIRIDSLGNEEVLNVQENIQAPVVVMKRCSSGYIWIGTRGNGIFRMDPANPADITRIGSREGMENLFVNALREDRQGQLWVGTEDGLYKLDDNGKSVTRFDMEGVMEKEVIVGILDDSKGRLWLSHWDGLTVIDPDAGKGRAVHYDRQDKVQGGFFYNNCSFRAASGELIIAGSNGFNIIDPSFDNINPYFPQLVLKDFQVNNTPMDISAELELGHDENSISFEFAALHYAAPNKIQYAYKLEGFEEAWHYENADRRFANYTNLSPGSYKFMVKATNNDGMWGEPEMLASIAVLPPWWKTIYAIAAYIAFFILVLWAFRKIVVIRTNFINDLEMERVKRENVEEMNKAKLEFFTNISHEFRTPLTLILAPLNRVMESAIADKEVRGHLDIIHRNSQRLLRLISQLMDFRKTESGMFRLEAAEGDILKFIREIKLSFDDLAERNKLDFQLVAPRESITAWYDRDQFEKILYNLVSNAIKNTPQGGAVWIEVFEEEHDIVIRVADNGKGIEKENLENVFQRFFSGSDIQQSAGSGIGLALTKNLVELHGGNVQVESTPNVYTCFTVRIPRGKDHLKPDDILADFRDSEHISKYPPRIDQEVPEVDMQTQATTSRDAPRLLIVEDNRDVRKYITSIFQKEFRILEAGDGREGLELAMDKLPDLIISDVMMPEVSGTEMCRRLKEDIRTSHIPVILLTARTPLIFKREGLETGADDYITKPFDPRSLELKVRNILNLKKAIRDFFRDNKVLDVEPDRISLSSADERFIRNVLDSIEKNMDNSEYTVEDLGTDAGLSRMQLYRKIKALTGQSVNEFIRTIRLKRAAQLLEHGELTIAEVTYEVGFSDLKYFRKCFKKQFGKNPSDYASGQNTRSLEKKISDLLSDENSES